MPKKRKGKPTPDLPHIEGAGVSPQPRNPTLERLADDWIDAKTKQELAKEKADEAKEWLASQMRNSNTLVYQYDGHLIRLEAGKDKITVKDVDSNVTEE